MNPKDRLSRNSGFEFHYTPTHASWLNQVEMWFSIPARRFLKDGIFNSMEGSALTALSPGIDRSGRGLRMSGAASALRGIPSV
jgi:hypothetical protein